jgi:thiosulfate/3-mercaptopyruvate sulfurtransferase
MLAEQSVVREAVVSELINTEALARLLGAVRPPVVIDSRWRLGGPSTLPDFLAGHLPSAVWADLDADLSDPPGPRGRHPLPAPDRLERSMRRWGIDSADAVVVYDSSDSTAAARAWWVLRWAGVEDVRVLDGGLAAWLAGNYPVETGEPEPRSGSITVQAGSMPVIDAVATACLGRHGRLLDARARARYLGEVEPIDPVAGHIPGAVSAPTTGNVGPDGRFLSGGALRARFAQLLGGGHVVGDQPQRVGAYCGSGVTASHTILALTVAGLPAVLYPDSWSGWLADPARPVAVGVESSPGVESCPDQSGPDQSR